VDIFIKSWAPLLDSWRPVHPSLIMQPIPVRLCWTLAASKKVGRGHDLYRLPRKLGPKPSTSTLSNLPTATLFLHTSPGFRECSVAGMCWSRGAYDD